jgi:hypothetical protein
MARSPLFIVLGIGLFGVAALVGPPILDAYHQRQAKAAEERYHRTATDEDGYRWADMMWPETETKCPQWNPAYAGGCARRVRERMAERRADDLRRQALVPSHEEMVAAMVRRSESGEEAGYDWARSRGVTDESSCSNQSDEFSAGCSRYVGETAQLAEP